MYDFVYIPLADYDSLTDLIDDYEASYWTNWFAIEKKEYLEKYFPEQLKPGQNNKPKGE